MTEDFGWQRSCRKKCPSCVNLPKNMAVDDTIPHFLKKPLLNRKETRWLKGSHCRLEETWRGIHEIISFTFLIKVFLFKKLTTSSRQVPLQYSITRTLSVECLQKIFGITSHLWWLKRLAIFSEFLPSWINDNSSGRFFLISWNKKSQIISIK